MIWDEDIIDRIYECAVNTERWPHVLDEVARRSGHDGGFVASVDASGSFFTTSPCFSEGVSVLVNSGLLLANPISQRTIYSNHFGFITDLDLFDANEFLELPIRSQFGDRYNMRWGTGEIFSSPDGTTHVIRFNRFAQSEPTTRAQANNLNLLRPHLARAAVLLNQVWKSKAIASTETLESLGLAAAVVTRKGRILGANPKFIALQGQVQFTAFDRIAFANPSINQVFQKTLEAIATGNQRGVKSIAVPAFEDRPAFVAHLLPIRRTAADFFRSSLAVMIVSPLVRGAAPDASSLQALFDLTPAEAVLARSLQQGDSIAAIAKESGLTTSTLRSRLKTVFQKTGVHRQGELIALLSGLSI